MTSLKSQFLLDPDVVFLNHGSFGATPRPVFEVYQRWQRRLERQPVQFIVNALGDHLAAARQALGAFINAPADDLVYVPNATFAVNVVARALALGPHDELLTTDHEYGACNNVWEFMRRKRGFAVVRQSIPLPATTPATLIDQFWAGVTPRTRVIFLSHITSPTALILPVAEICARARAAGIITVIDGAHAVGQIPLDMAAIDADVYISNNHKWLLAPKGSAFLYARPSMQPQLEPLVVGWGWGEERDLRFGSDFLDSHQWLGTNDLSAYLATPAAMQFQHDFGWEAVRQNCHRLALAAWEELTALSGQPAIYPKITASDFFRQMFVVALPPDTPAEALKQALYADYRIEVPVIEWHGRIFLRVSIQRYNTVADVQTLAAALRTLLPRQTESG